MARYSVYQVHLLIRVLKRAQEHWRVCRWVSEAGSTAVTVQRPGNDVGLFALEGSLLRFLYPFASVVFFVLLLVKGCLERQFHDCRKGFFFNIIYGYLFHSQLDLALPAVNA